MALSGSQIAMIRFAEAAVMIAAVTMSALATSWSMSLLYFTIQSNVIGIAVLIWGGLNAVSGRTIAACPRLSFIATISLLLTAIVFWGLLAPFMKVDLLTFPNLTEHLFGPIFIIVDRLKFYMGHAPSGKGPLIALVHPLLYMAIVMPVGICQLVRFPYGWFPYPFLDVTSYGPIVFVFIAILALVIVILAVLWSRLERRRLHDSVLRSLTRRRRSPAVSASFPYPIPSRTVPSINLPSI